jgi:hypothetical protein
MMIQYLWVKNDIGEVDVDVISCRRDGKDKNLLSRTCNFFHSRLIRKELS